MSDIIALGATAITARAPRKLKIAFVADQFVPPVCDGSTYVYKNWIDLLAETCDLYAILFSSFGGDTAEAERYLAARCTSYLILPGASRSRFWRFARAASRLARGRLFAAQWIEEYGRANVHRTIADFAARHSLDLFLVSKLASIPLFGENNIRRLDATFLLDAHDDFVLRDQREREVLAALLARFPALRRYRRFREMRLRHLLSRLAMGQARAQEGRLFDLFDCVLSSSLEEHAFYRSSLGAAVPCAFLGWPPRRHDREERLAASASIQPVFDAGFIGGDHPFNVEAAIFFCTRVLPLIRQHRPDFKFLIVGHVVAPLSLMAPSWPGAALRGYLPDARSFYEQVRMSVVPLLSGTGVSVKALEALDLGKLVVATRMGARGLAGITGISGHPRLHIAESAEDFASKVLALRAEMDGADGRCSGAEPTAIGRSSTEFEAAFDRLLRAHGRRGIQP